MYHHINPTETFRERHLLLLREAEDKRRARRLGGAPKAARASHPTQAINKRTSATKRSQKTLLGACLVMVVATLMAACLMAAQPAHASTTFTVNSASDFADVKVG